MAACPRDRRAAAPRRGPRRPDLLLLLPDRPHNIRNKADIGGGALYDIGCYAIATARYIFGAEPERAVGLIDRDPALLTDRLTSGLAEFPGNRHLTFSCATQLVPHQRVTISGTKGRIEVQIPFNPTPDASHAPADRRRHRSGRQRHRGRGVSALRPVHAPGRRVLPRRAGPGGTAAPDRRRRPQHARDRRLFPLGQGRHLGAAMTATTTRRVALISGANRGIGLAVASSWRSPAGRSASASAIRRS